MRAFADLYADLDSTTKTSKKVQSLARYFADADPRDAAWAVYFLVGRRPRQVVPSRKLKAWATEQAGIPAWLFEESYHAVGDLAETIALLLPAPTNPGERPLHEWVEQVLLPLADADEAEQRRQMLSAWAGFDQGQRLVWNKLITGSFRVGVSAQLLTRALAEVARVEATVVAHRLMGDWNPTPAFYQSLLAEGGEGDNKSRPYPFFLAAPLEADAATLGDLAEWQVEWKWDGIRAQLIRRGGEVFLWSRGEELVSDRYPEIVEAAARLPDGTVIDGEVLPWREGAPLPFAQLQRRIGRKSVGKKVLAEVPVVLLAYDLLERQGADLRECPLSERRRALEAMAGDGLVTLSPVVEAASWEELAAVRESSRDRHVEGLMLKRRSSPYRVGRVRGDWWKWKVEPLTVDAVLVYAQRGSGKRASLYTDYTFAVWEAGELLPFAKAYSGLTDEEIKRVDAFVRKNTVEKFGPVRSVTPKLVFELAFEGLQRSPRHSSGVAVRFPRILRWRHDKAAAEADTLDRVKALLPQERAAERRWTQGELFVKAFKTDHFDLPLPTGHRFPIAKYRLLRERIEASGLIAPEDLVEPPAATDEEILRVHDPEYLRKLQTGTLSEAEQRRIGFPWSSAMLGRSRRSAGGTIAACRAALTDGVAVNLAGGTHHAFRDAGEGFCVLNDSVIAARALQADGLVSRVVVIDLDVHQGNGTAALCRDDPSVFTFSLHGAKNFPLRKETSDLDIELPDGTADREYLEAVERGVFEALHRARAELAIYLAGADPFEGDRLGRLKVTKAGLARRTEVVLEACLSQRLPVAVTMAGGYAQDVNDTADIYFETVRLCAAWAGRWVR